MPPLIGAAMFFLCVLTAPLRKFFLDAFLDIFLRYLAIGLFLLGFFRGPLYALSRYGPAGEYCFTLIGVT